MAFNIDKFNKKINDSDYIIKLLEENKIKESLIIDLVLDGKPENYSRERKGRGSHFYNPKAEKMSASREILKKQLDKNIHKKLINLFSNENAEFYTTLELTYYLPIQKTSSLEDAIKKELGIVKPAIRPDIDNYDKFILDTLHEIAYNDDSKVIKLLSQKAYSIKPRTEIAIKIDIIKE